MLNNNKFLLATNNAHKVEEIRAILHHSGWILDSLASYGDLPEPEENGSTYQDNALIKARHYYGYTQRPCIADDSGLEIDAMDGAPGLHSSRFGGATLPHAEKIAIILDLLRDVPEAKRTARFRCCAVCVGLGQEPIIAERVCEGRIALAPSGVGGFGYDPIFYVEAAKCTMAELDAQRKNSLSHRGQAMRALAALIREFSETAQ